MSSIPFAHSKMNSSEARPGELGSGLTVALALGAGLGVAPLYYAQPMLGLLAAELPARPEAVGWIPTLTQLGYAAGLLLLAPLGDRFDRRSIVMIKSVVLGVALAGAALVDLQPEVVLIEASLRIPVGEVIPAHLVALQQPLGQRDPQRLGLFIDTVVRLEEVSQAGLLGHGLSQKQESLTQLAASPAELLLLVPAGRVKAAQADQRQEGQRQPATRT